jgi:hypothetical protein
VLGDRNGPVYPRTLRSWMMCPAATRTPESPASHVAAAGFWRRMPAVKAHPGQLRARLIRPKSCRYHFAAEALLTLI